MEMGLAPKIIPTRGTTDGALLTMMNIPCPNIGTGGHNPHSVFEYIAVEDLEVNKDLLVGVVKSFALNDKMILKRKKEV